MYMTTEIIKIIEGGLEKNREKVLSYASLLAEKLRQEGENKFADRIKSVLEKRTVHPVYMDEFLNKPVDSDSSLDMVDVSFSPKRDEQIILPEITELKVRNYVSSLKNRNQLIELGVHQPESLLLYGPPGCGKTSIAHFIAQQTGLPLVTAKLDGLISSLLGSTAKNIRKVFEYAKERPCILFLDEFDAIAKSRNDSHEVGELKRVVNSLLQNIDDFNENNILIAATNHETLLDPAVWRRFTTVIEVPTPSKEEILLLLKNFLKSIECEFINDNKKLSVIGSLLVGFSPAAIKTLCYNAIRNTVIAKSKLLSYSTFIYEIYLFSGEKVNDISLCSFLNNHGVSQVQISKLLGIGIRQVRHLLKEEGGGYDDGIQQELTD